MQSTISLLSSQPVDWISMPAVSRAANPPPCLAEYIKFSMKTLISDKTDL